jgi:hypothetical protein
MRATNTKVIIEHISEVAAIFAIVEFGTSTEIGSSLPKIIGSPASTGINDTYLKFSLMYLVFSWFSYIPLLLQISNLEYLRS